MPELPEVETIARGVDARVRGRQIVSVWLGSKPEPFRSSPAEIAAALVGSTLERVHRVGKHIVVDLARERAENKPKKNRKPAVTPDRQLTATGIWHGQWLIHLGMTGRLLVSQPEIPVAPHTHAIVQLDDDREIRFIDPRRFGRLSVLNVEDLETSAGKKSPASTGGRFAGTGREPLDISLEEFQLLFRGRHTPIKSALLNQKLLHGVGNIYADESLFRAGIRPRRLAGRLKGRELGRLHAAVQSVLQEAIALGGSSVSDYVDAEGAKGFFQLEHRVYLRTGEPCLVCQTPIRRIVLGGRGTHYCPKCQG
jgi:formamidopyrimidine-DNA glycosylase